MKHFLTPLALAGAVALAACTDSHTPLQPEDGDSPVFGHSRAQPQRITFDERMASVALPGFAGVYVDDEGRVTMPIARVTAADVDVVQARQALDQVFTDLGVDLSTSDVRFVEVTYSFAELSGWRDIARDMIDDPGVVALDVDEVTNRLELGVLPGVNADALVAALAAEGVPPEAIMIRETEPFRFDTTLRDKVRPVVGGLQMQRGSGGICTIGFNADWGADRVFVTNSHCSGGQGGVQGHLYYQPVDDSGGIESTSLETTSVVPNGPWIPPDSEVGREVHDPVWAACGFYFCRYSDAALILYHGGVVSDLGKIARTTGIGSITISSSSPRWTITGETSILVGQVAHRVGRTTGYQRGAVTSTCKDITIAPYRVLCSVEYDVGAGGGDSGAPVFRVVASGTGHLAGIHFGSDTVNFKSFYSPISQIRDELETPAQPLTTY